MVKNITKKIMIIIGVMLLIVIVKSPISKATTTYQAGENVTAVLDDQGTLTISGTGEMTNWIFSSDIPWYTIKNTIKKVVINNGVTSIGDYAFENCYSLKEVTISSSVKSIGNYAFVYCSRLTEVTIPSGVTNIGYGAFEECSSLKAIIIPNSVTSIGAAAFYGCSSLRELTIPSSITSIGSKIFYGVKLLKFVEMNETGKYSIGLPEIIRRTKTKGDILYTETDSTLTNCTISEENKKLNFSKLPDDNKTISIQINGGALEGLTLQMVVLETWDVSKNKDRSVLATLSESGILTINGTGEMTNGNSSSWYSIRDSIKKVVINENITNIGNSSFYGCSSLTEITIPSSVKSIGNYAFQECRSLTEITIPSSVTSIGSDAFAYCSSLRKITIPSSITSIEDATFAYCSSLTEITIPSSVTSIGSRAFYRCISLKEAIIPSSVTSIGSDVIKYSYKAVIITEKGSTADTYTQENSINRITYSTMDWTNKDVDIELNGEKVYTYTVNGKKEIEYTYRNDINESIVETTTTEVNWIDKDAPIISGLLLSTTEWTNKNITLTVEATDSLSGLEEQSYSWDGKNTWTANKTYGVSKNGTYTVYVKDKLGNISSKSITVSNIYEIGNINEDEKIDVTDLLLVKRHIVSGSKTEWKLRDKKLLSADINKDGKVDITDLLLVKRHVVSGNKEEWKIK